MCQHWPKYQAPSRIQKAVASKEAELKELYGIEKSAMSLAALLEAQNQKRAEFETHMTMEREELETEITTMREGWEKERKAHELEVKQRDTEEKKARDQE